jgi:hypothetical protein
MTLTETNMANVGTPIKTVEVEPLALPIPQPEQLPIPEPEHTPVRKRQTEDEPQVPVYEPV